MGSLGYLGNDYSNFVDTYQQTRHFVPHGPHSGNGVTPHPGEIVDLGAIVGIEGELRNFLS